jgi:GTP-binding protein
VSRPRVVTRMEDGIRMEPVEEVTVDVDEEYSGSVVEKMSQRKADLIEMKPSGGGKQRLIFLAPSRGLIGYHGEFLTDTRGTGIMNRLFHSWTPWKGPIQGRRVGALVSLETGDSVAYALFKLDDRGRFFIGAGEKIYEGMVLGENTRSGDLEVNPVKGKQLTNMRASGKDEAVTMQPPKRMSLEESIAWIEDDELVEVTPNHIRIRKRWLDPVERKRRSREMKSGAA